MIYLSADQGPVSTRLLRSRRCSLARPQSRQRPMSRVFSTSSDDSSRKPNKQTKQQGFIASYQMVNTRRPPTTSPVPTQMAQASRRMRLRRCGCMRTPSRPGLYRPSPPSVRCIGRVREYNAIARRHCAGSIVARRRAMLARIEDWGNFTKPGKGSRKISKRRCFIMPSRVSCSRLPASKLTPHTPARDVVRSLAACRPRRPCVLPMKRWTGSLRRARKITQITAVRENG